MLDTVTLKKNGWHYKLQKFVFGRIPYKNNFCPYFWLTIFCAIALPFVSLFKLLAAFFYIVSWPFVAVINKAYNAYETRNISDLYLYKISKSLRNGWMVGPEEEYEDLKSKIENVYYTGKLINILRFHYNKDPGNFRNRFINGHIEYHQFLQEYSKSKANKLNSYETVKKSISGHPNIVKYTKYLLALIIGIVGIYFIYGLALICLILYENTEILITLLTAIAIIVVASTLGFLIVLFAESRQPRRIGKFFKRIFSPVTSVFNFIKIYFTVFKEQNCPAINWNEDGQDDV